MMIMEAPVSLVTLLAVLGVLNLSFPWTSEDMLTFQYYSTVAGIGNPECATGIPSSVESATNRLRCGHLCVLKPFCYHFNYFTQRKLCSMYYTPPKSFGVLEGCRSYKAQPQPRGMNVIADEVIEDIYADGTRIPSVPIYSTFMTTGTFFFPRSTRILAIRITNTVSGVAGLLASEINGNLLTNAAWKVRWNYTDGWMKSTVDDSDWEQAAKLDSNPSLVYGNQPSISSEAVWITAASNNRSSVLYFRLHVYT